MFIVAKNKYIEELYQYDQLTPEEESEHLFRLPVWSFEVFWQADLFPIINRSCDVRIASSWIEIIPHEKLPCIVYAIDHACLKIVGPNIQQFCMGLRNLCSEGINRKTSLFAEL